MASGYCIQKTDSSFCPKCQSNVHLLAPIGVDSYGPSFYICFICGFVGEVGRGKVEDCPND